MLRGVFITLLLAAVAHNTLADGGDDMGKDRPKFPCCPPRKFEANVINLDMDIDSDIRSKMAFDADKGLNGLAYYDTSMKKVVWHVLTDYKKEVMYMVNATHSDSSKHTCMKMNIDSTLYRSCFGSRVNIDSSRFVYLGESTLGPMASGVEYDAWLIHRTDGYAKSRVAMTRDGCLPLVESTEGVANDRHYFRKMLYTQASLTNSIPDLLTLSPSCM